MCDSCVLQKDCYYVNYVILKTKYCNLFRIFWFKIIIIIIIISIKQNNKTKGGDFIHSVQSAFPRLTSRPPSLSFLPHIPTPTSPQHPLHTPAPNPNQPIRKRARPRPKSSWRWLAMRRPATSGNPITRKP